MSKDGYVYRERTGADAGAPLLVLFHGTGGNEDQFFDIGGQLLPGAHLLAVRGDVSENGALRYFRRTGEGQYDMADLALRTAKMIGFLKAHIGENRPARVFGLGYSNGANIIASVMFEAPGLFDGAVLMHPLIPFKPAPAPGLAGKRVLITAGPTFEPIDPVRGVTNLSSGKMGYALARAAREAGASVTLVSGPTALDVPYGVQRINVQTAQQMHDVVLSHVGGQDIFIAVAAVADWRITNASAQKLKKSGDGMPQLQFEHNPDILATVAALPKRPYCVGFAAESENLLQHGAEKRKNKNIPLLVGNIGHQTFGKDDNTLVLFDDNGHVELPRAGKQALARQLITNIAARL